MKTRESGMPPEEQWAAFFDPRSVLDRLGLQPGVGDIVEFGCGFGTFTIPAAERSGGVIHALDIDPEMVDLVASKASAVGLANVVASVRDFVAHGTGLPDRSVDYAMLFNILHAEHPHVMLREAWRVLASGGVLGVMHWNYDASTPRGPSMEIRPRPEDCGNWALAAGFRLVAPGIVDLPPYHYGMAFEKT
jgi:ubiquinone/menaquinone biosynthesis C-methylase UbiE